MEDTALTSKRLCQGRHNQPVWQVSLEQALSGMSWGNHSFPDGGSSVLFFFPALLGSTVLVASHQGGGAGSKVHGMFVTMEKGTSSTMRRASPREGL